jgi:hypothetical protein
LGHGRKKSVSSAEIPPVVPPSLNVTGDVTPDCKCNYYEAGVFNEHPFYKRGDGQWYIWRRLGAYWYITQILGELSGPRWLKVLDPPIGNYTSIPPATGTAVVSAGGH